MDVKAIVSAVLRGLYDSIKGMGTLIYLDREMNNRIRSRLSPSRANTPIRPKESDHSKENVPGRTLKQYEESKVLKRTIQCSILNGGIFLLSILLFEYGILPLINSVLQTIFGSNSFMSETIWSWIEPFLIFIFQTMWVLPLFLLRRVVNNLWFQTYSQELTSSLETIIYNYCILVAVTLWNMDIADSAYRYSRGRPQLVQSLSKLIADSLISTAVQTLFLMQACLVELIPLYIIGKGFALIHMCLLYSLYAFEYKWFNMGWELHRRLTYIEINWPYFIGFGLPLAVLSEISQSPMINGCIFSILFPLFIVSGNEANPVTDVCPYSLHLFSPVVAISNTLLNKSIGATKNVNKPVQLTR